MDEKCIVCGEVIPEGRQICPTCERKTNIGRCSPCKECDKHGEDLTCHATCQDYIDWREYKNEEAKWLKSLVGPESIRAKQIIRQRIIRRARGRERKGGRYE